MFFARLKTFLCALLASLAFLGSVFFVWSVKSVRFPEIEGERAYYLRSASSQAFIKDTLAPWDFASVKGESVVFSCEGKKTVDDLLSTYRAQVLFVEETDGTISYYCYTPRFYDGVRIKGAFVNLHIAHRETRCAVGSPIIFGGF